MAIIDMIGIQNAIVHGEVVPVVVKFATDEEDRFLRYYLQYFKRFARESPANHKQMEEILRRCSLVADDFDVICDMMRPERLVTL